MSRTHKGSKGPGWEPWSNRHEKAAEKADFVEPVLSPPDESLLDDICKGCRMCRCIKCGGHMGAIDPNNCQTDVRCIECGHEEPNPDVP